MTADLDLGVEFETDARANGAHFSPLDFYDEEAELDYAGDDGELDDDEFESEDDEILPLLAGAAPLVAGLLPGAISAGASAVKSLVNTATRPFIRKPSVKPANYGRHVTGTNRGSIITSRGPIAAQFSKPFVTSAQLKAALESVRRDVSRVSTRVESVHSGLDKQIKSVSQSAATGLAAEVRSRSQALKKADIEWRKRLKKTRDELRTEISQGQMLPLLMSTMGGASDPMMMAVMAMSMGSGSSTSTTGGTSNDAFSNPLMMVLLMQSMNK